MSDSPSQKVSPKNANPRITGLTVISYNPGTGFSVRLELEGPRAVQIFIGVGYTPRQFAVGLEHAAKELRAAL